MGNSVRLCLNKQADEQTNRSKGSDTVPRCIACVACKRLCVQSSVQQKEKGEGSEELYGKPEGGYQFISLPVCLLP